MLTAINPKIPLRDKAVRRNFYLNKLGFHELGSTDYDGYLIVQKEFSMLDPDNNLLTFGQSIFDENG